MPLGSPGETIFPGIRANISGFVESGQRLGSSGELTTVWNDDGEGLFNLDWFGVLFGGAAGWQPGKSDGAAYQATFGTTLDLTTSTIGPVGQALIRASSAMMTRRYLPRGVSSMPISFSTDWNHATSLAIGEM